MQRVIEEKAAAQRRAHDEAVARSAAEQREQVKSLSCPKQPLCLASCIPGERL
jgi:hypothetical protein